MLLTRFKRPRGRQEHNFPYGFIFRTMSSTLKYENVWTEKAKYDDAETQYYERLTKVYTNCERKSFLV